MKIKITNKEIRNYLNLETPEFPKYATQIINLANQNSQGTRPKTVGQMSELIQKFTGKKLSEWEIWYKQKHPEAIKNAAQKIFNMVQNLKEVVGKIDEKMIEKWVKDLVITQTFIGLKFQEALLRKIADIKKCSWKLATPSEESKGIDGYIKNTPISIKPETYKIKPSLQEKIGVKILYYKKVKDGIEVDLSNL